MEILGHQFKAKKFLGRVVYRAVIEGEEITIAYSDIMNPKTDQPNGWYWDFRRDTSRRHANYYATPEAAFLDAFKS